MKKSRIVFCLLYLMISSTCNAAFIDVSTVVPEGPTTSDSIVINISGELRNSNDFFTADTPSVTIVDNNIDIGIFAQSPSVVLPAIKPYELDANIGILAAGSYNYEIDFYNRGVLQQSVSSDFRVVPLPPAILLMLSALSLLIYMRRV